MIDPNTWLAWASWYAQRGFAVMPLAGKRPLTPRGVYDASADPTVWLQWVQQFPGCNIGLAVPDGCAVIDVDPRNGGAATFDRLDDVEHAIPRDTLQVTTGGGGLHVFVQLAAGYALPSTLGPGVDVKQFGGYVVAAPSVHPITGQHYRVMRDAPVAYAPATLVARATARGASKAKALAADEIDDARRDAAGWGLDPDLVVQDVSPEQIQQAVRAVESIYVPGQRHHVRVKMGSVLNRLGWSSASVEAFGHALYEEYGGDNPHKIARETVRGMGYPSGYYELVAMAGQAGAELATALDGLHNPYGVHLREARAASAADVMARLAKLEAQAAENPTDDEFFGWLADDADDVPIDPLIVGLDIADGRTTGVAGLPHAAKTPTSMAIALCVANGVPWLGRDVKQRPVIYLNFEKGFDAISKRRRIAQGLDVDPKSVHLLNLGDKAAFLNDKTGTIDKATAIVKRVRDRYGETPLVIVDTLSNSVAGVEHNSADYAEPIRTLIVSMRQVCPVPALVLLHCRKALGENMRPKQNDIEGSVQIVGICDAIIGLYKPHADKPSVVSAVPVRTLADEQPDITFEWEGTKDTPLTFRELDEKGDAKPVRERPIKRADRNTEMLQTLANLVEASPDGATWSQEQLKIAAKVTSRRSEVNDAFRYAAKVLIEDGRLQAARGKHGAITYRRTPNAELLALRGDASRAAGLAPSPMYGGFGLSQNGPPLPSNVLPFPGVPK